MNKYTLMRFDDYSLNFRSGDLIRNLYSSTEKCEELFC